MKNTCFTKPADVTDTGAIPAIADGFRGEKYSGMFQEPVPAGHQSNFLDGRMLGQPRSNP